MACERVIAGIVCRNCHDCPGAITGEHIVADPNGNFLSRKRIDCIRAGEHPRHFLVYLPFAFGLVFNLIEVSIDCIFLFRRSKLCNICRFRSKHHKSDTEDGVGAGSEYFQLNIFP